MEKVFSHYENLKVARNAPLEVIRAAYRSLSQKYHPDRNPGDSDAARIMTLLNVAYETLSDSDKRMVHDKWIAETEEGSSTAAATQAKEQKGGTSAQSGGAQAGNNTRRQTPKETLIYSRSILC